MQLRHCPRCDLCFRFPKDDERWLDRFYQGRYHEEGYIVDLPEPARLQEFLDTRFHDSRLSFSSYISWVQACRPSGRLLDFGASWGYGVWQFLDAGYAAVGYEVDGRRASFGRRHLGVDIVASPEGLCVFREDSFDIVFTAHTLEHLASPLDVYQEFERIVVPSGWLVVVVPNCSGITNPEVSKRKRSWAYGRKHLLAYTAEFFARSLPEHGFRLSTVTSDLGEVMLSQQSVRIGDPELLVVARRIA